MHRVNNTGVPPVSDLLGDMTASRAAGLNFSRNSHANHVIDAAAQQGGFPLKAGDRDGAGYTSDELSVRHLQRQRPMQSSNMRPREPVDNSNSSSSSSRSNNNSSSNNNHTDIKTIVESDGEVERAGGVQKKKKN